MAINDNFQIIKNQIAAYEKKYARNEGSVQLLVASKTRSIDEISVLIACGQKAFGESYVQEAIQKIRVITDPTIAWHFIGPIQSNKTRKIAEHFSWVHSVDNLKIAKRLNDQRPEALPPLNICIEVNVSQEKTKSGVNEAELFALVQACLTLPKLKLRGLMTIPAPKKMIPEQRAQFHKLFMLQKKLQDKGIALDTLSMGMSEDFEAAIAEGATIVRIGSALFVPQY